jgi:hypothetical protein
MIRHIKRAALLVVCFLIQDLNAMTDDPSREPVDIKPVIEQLFSAFAESNAARRETILSRTVTADVKFWTRTGVLSSRNEVSSYIGQWQEDNNGHYPGLITDIQAFRNVARAGWESRLKGRFLFQRGESYFELGDDGLLTEIINFSDPPHHVLVGGAPQAYVDAWNTQDPEEKVSTLSAHWADDGRWVEMRFDVSGPDAIAQTMKAPITLEPVDGVMDVMRAEGHGQQVRFEVDVTHNDGRVIGRFTDFVSLDESGRASRLAGFKGASLTMKHKLGRVDPDWNWSYISGYEDANGVFAGGSEVMHLAAYKGRLYGANGYWEDNHWVVPEGADKQSAQVLRLDSPEGKWVVDLDMGETSPDGIHIMKGNILKTLTFTMDGEGNVFEEPVEVLFMAASNIYSHTSMWTLNDDSGEWEHQTVKSGERKPNIRWVPRDVEVRTDRVTGQERIYLLLGNIGVISGVYDPNVHSRIRWDADVEFPEQGELDVRALGMVEANGVLYFSAGRYLYQRNDGPDPSWELLLDMTDDDDVKLNVEMGGIRGLSAIDTPNGEGQSLIFMWAPHGRTRATIIRLDPEGDGSYTRHDEVLIGDLVPDFLGQAGRDVEVWKVLGAYNNFYEMTDPETGETIHLFGYQLQLMGNDDIVGQSRYYKGGTYVIRTADQKYHLGEINGLFEPGKARIIGPRSFVISPFGDDHIYSAGYDSNFVESTGMAWIFNAHRDTWLAPMRQQD